MTSGDKEFPPRVGAGCRKVDVGALLVFRGVKCCCRVLNAGLVVLVGSSLDTSRRRGSSSKVSSGLGAGCVASPLLEVSGCGLRLAVRLGPASLAEALACTGAESAEAVLDLNHPPGGTSNDLGRAIEFSALLLDCVRV
jgi:hypothetical protein